MLTTMWNNDIATKNIKSSINFVH